MVTALLVKHRYTIMIRFIILMVTMLLMAIPAHARDTMVFVTYSDSDTPNIVFARAVLTEAYNRLGIDIEVRYLPGYRMFKKANNGDVDGLLFNVPDLGPAYPGLIRVNSPVFYSHVVAFTRNESIKITDWESLKPYQVGYVRGFLLVKERTKHVQTDVLDEQENMMLMLAHGRIDVAVDTYLTGIFTINKLGLLGIKAISPALEQFASFHYLHKKHADLVPQIEIVLSTMEKEGAILAIRNVIMKKILDEK